MIVGGNWWRAKEIVIRHLTRQTKARHRSRDKAAGTFVIAAIAVLTARSLIAPLSALATAADALGRSPEILETPRPAIRELAAIHDAFEAMQRRLKCFVDERTRMLAAISHDLRTPLTRLRLQAEFIADGEPREVMLANIDAMGDMLAETLSFAEGGRKFRRVGFF